MREIPKEAPKRVKRKETEGQNALTLELLSMELKKQQKRGEILKKPKAQKKKRKREKSETHTNYLCYKKQTKGGRSRTLKRNPKESKTQEIAMRIVARRKENAEQQ